MKTSLYLFLLNYLKNKITILAKLLIRKKKPHSVIKSNFKSK